MTTAEQLPNYRSIPLDEHEPLTGRRQGTNNVRTVRIRKPFVTALSVVAIIVVAVVTTTVGALIGIRVADRQPSSNVQNNLQQEQQRLWLESDARFERWEEWKQKFLDIWGPFSNKTENEWEDFERKFQGKEETASDKAREWMNDTETETGDLTTEAKGWLTEEKERTGKLWNDTETESGELTTEAKDWLTKEEERTRKWWNDTETETGELTTEAEEWLTEEEENMGKLWNRSSTKTSNWVHHAEQGTELWFDETVNKTEDWVGEEDKKVAAWWNLTRHKTIGWFRRAGHWFQGEAIATEDWFNETEHEAGDFFHNLTHHDKSKLPEFIVYMNHTSAYRMLTHGLGFVDESQDYFLIHQGYEAQMNQAYCPVATSVAILNSLRGYVDLPMDPIYDPYAYATQPAMFNDCTNANVIHKNETFDGIFAAPGGLGMPQTKALLQCHLDVNEWNITAVHLDPLEVSIDAFRHDLVSALLNPLGRVMINYERTSVGQIGGGHWSPIGSYSRSFDAFLVMDVAKYKYPNAWISTSLLYKSLQTLDACGQWNFPDAQDTLPTDLLHSFKAFDYKTAMHLLGCKSTRRGYILIQKTV